MHLLECRLAEQPSDGVSNVILCPRADALTTTRVSAADSSLVQDTSHTATWTPLLFGVASLAIGAVAAIHYSRLGLALTHYDARAHLVVARRILDSLTPGWQQIGAVWLPLPHVLNMLPVQVDAWYRSGASAITISVLSMAVAAWALTRLLVVTTGSAVAAAAGIALLFLNPNVLYLQSTPMTEPLLIATCLLALVFTVEWVTEGAPLPPRRPGWAIVAACMTRYEAWPICAALILLSGFVLLRRGAIFHAWRACARLAVYPLVAAVLFTLNSRWTIGTWFVPSGFFVSENKALSNAGLALDQVRESVYLLSGTAWVRPAYAAALVLTVTFALSRRRAPLILVLALVAAFVLPWYAFYQGHPLRVRYGLPLVVACAGTTAAGIASLWKPLRLIAAAGVLVWAFTQSHPLDAKAPLVIESQRDAENMRGRQTVTRYLQEHWDHSTIMMSMGSLAHYMHDLSAIEIDIRDFLQEGNEQLWVHAASQGPRGFVSWVVIEERAEGGDSLFQAAQNDPDFLDGFERVAEGGGVALYHAVR
jgi:hypothetical protein